MANNAMGLGKRRGGSPGLAGRREADFYPTPEWCVDALLPHLLRRCPPRGGWVLEPGCGDGAIGLPLARAGYTVRGIDIRPECERLPPRKAKAARPPAPTEPGFYNVRWPHGDDPGDVMELMPDGRWRFVQGDGDPRNPSDPLPFIPGGVFTRTISPDWEVKKAPTPPQPAGTLELPLWLGAGKYVATTGNFLELPLGGEWASPLAIVGNPPYSMSMEFIKHSMDLLTGGLLALLLPLDYLSTQGRAAFWREHPADVLVFDKRPSFTGGGAASTNYGWYMWPTATGRGQIFRVGDDPGALTMMGVQ